MGSSLRIGYLRVTNAKRQQQQQQVITNVYTEWISYMYYIIHGMALVSHWVGLLDQNETRSAFIIKKAYYDGSYKTNGVSTDANDK